MFVRHRNFCLETFVESAMFASDTTSEAGKRRCKITAGYLKQIVW